MPKKKGITTRYGYQPPQEEGEPDLILIHQIDHRNNTENAIVVLADDFIRFATEVSVQIVEDSNEECGCEKCVYGRTKERTLQ